MEYTLGLDIGITSIGSCAIDQNNARLIELSVRKFDPAKEAKEARLNRSARRTLRRKKWRKDQLIAAFNDFNVLSKDEIGIGNKRNNFLSFYGKGDNLTIPNVYTIYHLRQKAIKEKVSKREILLCLYNILQARGHFLFDKIDFTKEGLSFDIFKEKFYKLAEQYVDFTDDKTLFEEKILKKIYSSSEFRLNDLKTLFKERYTLNEESDVYLQDICRMIAGGKTKIGYFYGMDDEGSLNVQDLKKKEELNEFQNYIVELYDICRISRILKDGNQYICDIAVKEIDKYQEHIKRGDTNSDDYNNWKNASKAKYHIRSYKNLNNSFPNGLYVKEVDAILHKQQQFYQEITDEFIEVCKSIASARIPYYIGPLGENAKNAWANKNGKIKYSYDYTIKHFDNIINEYETIKKWKENMVSHCTYLPKQIALPKGSLLGEVFSIINELNNYNCEDNNGNDYYLTRLDKIKVFDELFLKQDTVTLEQVKDCLNLKKYYSQKGSVTKFNNRITVYRQLASLCNELVINSITEIFSDKDKLNRIEEIILDINLFDEGSLKKNYFKEQFGEEIATKLSSIKSNGFYSFSKEFIFNTPMDENGETMLDILFDNNDSSFRNNQQYIISNACDKDGNKIDFLMDKYEKVLKENNNQLTIDLILDKGKPLIPISRPVVRALNEAFKVYNGYIETYGVPSRVVIETAKGKDSIKDFTEQKSFTENSGSSMKHYNQMPKLVDYLFDQVKECDKNNAILQGKIEEWKEIEGYYNNHKQEIELYIRQDGIDLLTGKRIDITKLEEYEVDHILPRGFGDDSQDDKMLISKIANGKKGDRLPIEFLESDEAIGLGYLTVGRFENIVKKLAEMKMISGKKKERLLLRSQDEAQGFINQNLVDTRYIISQFVSIINAFNRVNGYDTHVVCLNSNYTKLYSRVLNFKKDRDLGDQHHAYDAACVCIADKCLNEYFPNYDQQKSAFSKKGNFAGFGKYDEFVKELNKSNNSMDSKDKLRQFVFYAFKKAYGQDIYKLGKEAPLIEEIKSRVPLLSWKVEKNYDGQYFDVNPIKQEEISDSSITTVLGLNSSLKAYKSLNLVAIDFYKIKGKCYAIHIPYAIIDNEGNILKDQYINMINAHYKAYDLLDSNGDLIEKAFRFRVFKNDIIFDTLRNEPYLFAFGSAQKKMLELKLLNIYSYKNIYDLAGELKNKLIDYFDIKHYDYKMKKEIGNNSFKEIDKETMILYAVKYQGIFENSTTKLKYAYNFCKKSNDINELCLKLSYLANSINIKMPFDGEGRIRVSPNIKPDKKQSKDIHHNEQYIKIKYNILGVRFKNNDKGTLIVEGPKEVMNGGFKLIKKEDFYWTISKM